MPDRCRRRFVTRACCVSEIPCTFVLATSHQLLVVKAANIPPPKDETQSGSVITTESERDCDTTLDTLILGGFVRLNLLIRKHSQVHHDLVDTLVVSNPILAHGESQN